MSDFSFNSNITALRLQRSLASGQNTLSRVFERLSSGQRINRASDDAAGLAVASTLESQSRVLAQGIRNGNDAISLLNVAGGALTELSSVVERLKELAEQSANGSFSRTQRLSLDGEANSLTREFNRLISSTEFNGRKLLDGLFGRSRMQIGTGTNGGIDVGIGQQLARRAGTGAFGSAIAAPISAEYSVAGNFNADEYADIVVIRPDTGAGRLINVSLGKGDGSFTAGPGLIQINGVTVSVGDINGDGLDDVVSDDGGLGVAVFLSNGDGTFRTGQTVSVGSSVTSTALSDINNDGVLDLITGSSTTINVFAGIGNGKFQASSGSFSAGATISSIKTGDVDGDSRMDLIVGTASSLQTFSGAGNGTFALGKL